MILLSKIQVRLKLCVFVVLQGSIKALCPYLVLFSYPNPLEQSGFSTEENLKDSESDISRMLPLLSRHIIFDWDDCRG